MSALPINGNSHFWRWRWLIAVRLTVYVDHFYTILVSKGNPYRIPEMSRGCSSWFFLQTLRACGDLNLINSDLACWGEFDGTRISTKTKPRRPESEVRRGSTVKTKLVRWTERRVMRCIHLSEMAATHSSKVSFAI